ncbi:RDD family protein [Thioalkalivibrio sp.]|uniref:RDD family protein n=1 Tax=Thioalkalivibrio sp. TaxID=2093813 RepID=UPI003567AC68
MTVAVHATTEGEPAGLFRRLGAMIYDGLLLLAIWMVLGLLFVFLGNLVGRPMIPLQFAVNLLAAWLFLVGFWTRTGQTLGMQTWQIRLRDEGGGPVTVRRATLRYLVALAQWLLLLFAIHLAREYGAAVTIAVTTLVLVGLGLSQLHPRRLMLHDWLSGTVLVHAPRQASGAH